ncbi:MAG: chorismate--pyruvate lyase family protein [Candidatus Berkiellales bacterium]
MAAPKDEVKSSWVADPLTLSPLPSTNINAWLTKPKILSQALRHFCQQLTLKLIAQEFGLAFEDEYAILNLQPEALPLVRRIFLLGDDIPWTYGRVVVPAVTYEHHLAQFASLGANFLGEKLLYNNPDVQRSRFEYIALDESHPLFEQVNKDLATPLSAPLYGRRSVFTIKEDPLLVTEVFLPHLPEYTL